MSAIACKLYRINFPKNLALAVVSEIELAGVFEPIDPIIPIDQSDYQPQLQTITREKEQTAAAIGTLQNQLKSKSKSQILLNEKLAQDLYQNLAKYNKVIDQVKQLNLDRANLEKQISKIEQELRSFEPFKTINADIFNQTELVYSKVVNVPSQLHTSLKRSLSDIKDLHYFTVNVSDETQLWVLVYNPSLEEVVVNLISKKRLAQLHPSIFSHESNPQAIRKDLIEQKDRLIEQARSISDKLTDLAAKHLKSLQALYDIQEMKLSNLSLIKFVGYLPGDTTTRNQLTTDEKQLVSQQAQESDSLISSLSAQDEVHIDGWIDPDKIDLLTNKLNKISKEINLRSVGVKNDPEVRVVLKNNRLFRPFEVITSLMGTPSLDEPDPSPYVAPFFIGFFGFALGDAGYGLIMLLASLYFLRKTSRENVQMRNGVKLMLYCAVSTIFFGAITGGWFGANLRDFGQIGSALDQLKLIDLQSNIIIVLVGSLAIGFIHQLFGLILKMWAYIKNGQTLRAFEDPGSWLLLLVSIVSNGIIRTNSGLADYLSISNIVLLGAVAWFAYGQGHGAKNLLLRPIKGLTGLFNLTSYLSNTLSYARLLAMGLATGVIGSVVNLIATMFSPDIPVIGFVVTALILVAGHGFNIALNLLGTFINVARLHLVEFFPLFFDAKGILLKPVKIKTYYSRIGKDLSSNDLMSFS